MASANRITSVILAATLLTGCAAPGLQPQRGANRPNASAPTPSHAEIALWRLSDLARSEQPYVLLRSPRGIHGTLETGMLQRILATGEKILQAGGDGPLPELVVLGSSGVNAFSFFNGTQPTIALSPEIIKLLASDQDAWAALFGHELAHLRLDHLGGMKDRRKRAELTSSFAGLLLSAIGLPFANVAADATATLADRAYSRDDEREADRVSLEYMRRAGFDPQGALTLQQLLLTASGTGSVSFLSTHPSGEERMDNLRELMRSGN